MLVSRRSKRARRQPKLFPPEDQRGCNLVSGEKSQTRQRNVCSRESSPQVVSVTPLKRKGLSDCTDRSEQHSRKNQCFGLDQSAGRVNAFMHIDEESFDSRSSSQLHGSNLQQEPGNLVRARMDHSVTSIAQVPRMRGQYSFSSASQLVGEDIQCDVGLAFLYLGSDSEGTSENDPRWLGRYADRPGVTRWEPNSRKSRKVSSSSSDAKKRCNARIDTLYRSRISYEGVSINLGNHKSSTAAAASLDLANLALFGSDHRKDRHVLSREEGWKALRAVKMPGVRSCGQVDAFCSLLTEQRKAMFEQKIQEALFAIGGKDDFFADILSGVDREAFIAAEEVDEVTEVQRLEEMKIAKKRKARMRRAKRRKEKKKQRLRDSGKAPCERKQQAKVLSVDENGFVFGEEHGQYGINDIGTFFWRREMKHAVESTGEVRRPKVTAVKQCSVDRHCNLPSTKKAGERDVSAVDTLHDRKPLHILAETPLSQTEYPPKMEFKKQEPTLRGKIHGSGKAMNMGRGNEAPLQQDSGFAKNAVGEVEENATRSERFDSDKGALECSLGNEKAANIPDEPLSCDLKPTPSRVCSGAVDVGKEYPKTKRVPIYSSRISAQHPGKRKTAAATEISVVSRISIFQYSSVTESDSLDETDAGKVTDQQNKADFSAARQEKNFESQVEVQVENGSKNNGCSEKKRCSIAGKNVASFQIVSDMNVVSIPPSEVPEEANSDHELKGFAGVRCENDIVLDVSEDSKSKVVVKVNAIPSVARRFSVINKVSAHVSLSSNGLCDAGRNIAEPSMGQSDG